MSTSLIRNIILPFLAGISLFTAGQCLAKTINLYEQPKTDAKIVEALDASSGITPIYTPKNSDWIKVGDPKNGNVGWIKLTDLNDKSDSIATEFTVTQHTIDTSKGPKTYQMVQFGVPAPASKEATQAMIKEMQLRQAAIQKSVQSVMQNIFTSMNNLYQWNNNIIDQSHAPIFMPVIVLPPQPTTPPTKTK
jgi:hypothetical protein